MNTTHRSRVTGSMTLRTTIAAIALTLVACRADFDPKVYPSTDKLYEVALKQYNAHHWDNAAKAFEKLTTDMGIRDPRLPTVYFYLGQSQASQGMPLLAATTFNRLVDAFPQDTLVDHPQLHLERSYEKLWSIPGLLAQCGSLGLTA